MDLFPYQRDTVAAVVARAKVGEPTYIGHEMGLGKTPIAIAVAKERKAKRVGVFCPPVAKLTWEKELRRWWPGVPVVTVEKWSDILKLKDDGVFIVAYSLLSGSKSGGYDYTTSLQNTLKALPFDMSVLDEAHALKNSSAIRTKAVLKTLRPYLGLCLPMSGTPAPNHQGELFPILHAIFPKAIEGAFGKTMKQYEFENVYCRVVNKRFNGRMVRVIEGSQNIETLRGKLAGFMVRKTKRAVLPDLPDMAFDIYPVSAPNAPPWRGAHDWQDMNEDEFVDAFEDMHVATMRQQLGVSKVPGAVEAISEYLEGCRRKVVVFAHHTEVIRGLVDGLVHYGPVLIDGSVSKAGREIAVSRFLDDPKCRVFIGQTVAAGTSITLVGPNNDVSDVFFVESDFNPGNNVQAASRIHRIGQKNAVQVWFLTAHGTYDERIQDITSRKAHDFRELFG
jgi:SWI/SNF-related matrix-associated actin-dependent regulator 1 of chromatin subfamily A